MIILIAVGILAGCNLPVSHHANIILPSPSNPALTEPVATPTTTKAPTLTLEIATSTAHPSTATAIVTPSPLPSFTPMPTNTPTLPGLTPTYAILRGAVLEQSNCRYGPGAPFLFKYGLDETNVMQAIGRDETGKWILVRAFGGTNPCWLSAQLIKLNGDALSLKPFDPDVIMPWSPYYGPPKSVMARRNGSEVTVDWEPVVLRAGDDSGQDPYLIEAWVCSGKQLTFTVVGSYNTFTKIIDELGCAAPSHARLYAAEKHGYTRWLEIQWPK